MAESGSPRPLPQRPPHTFAVHWAVDAAIAMLVVLFPALLAGWDLVVLAGAAVLVGLIAAPWTLRREAEALARRPPPDEVD